MHNTRFVGEHELIRILFLPKLCVNLLHKITANWKRRIFSCTTSRIYKLYINPSLLWHQPPTISPVYSCHQIYYAIPPLYHHHYHRKILAIVKRLVWLFISSGFPSIQTYIYLGFHGFNLVCFSKIHYVRLCTIIMLIRRKNYFDFNLACVRIVGIVWGWFKRQLCICRWERVISSQTHYITLSRYLLQKYFEMHVFCFYPDAYQCH